jgi:hypothetical protein
MASSSDSSYWDQSNSSYYYNGSNYTDHAVTIVGWDDTYSRYNFSTTPPGNGAFIVKNSWGKGWGDNGYFYVSYYDSWIGSSENAVYDNAEPTNNYSHIYQWDPLGLCTWAWYFASGTTGWFANVFTAQSNDALAAVSFYSATPNSTYDVYTGNSVGGSKTLRTSGTLAVPGYHTVSLPSSVALSNGQSFVVFVRLTTPGWNWPVPLETPVNKGGASYSGSASASPGQSYVSASGSSWTDVTTFDGDSETNVCLKAFTSAAASPTPPTVTSPNGGGSWQVGDSQNITWTAGTGTGAAIAISRDGGSSWDDVATGLSNSGTYSWTVSGPATTQAKIRVTTSAGADASNAVFTITQASDGTPPTTTASGYDSAWHNTQVVVHLSAVDNGGSGVASTWYKVDSGSWTQGTLVTISAPAGGGNDGMHTVYFYSVDNATNTEAQKSCQVSIDTVGPICKAKNVTAKKGKLCKLHFYVGDAHSSQVTTVIRVKTLAGATKKTFSWGYDTANKWWITTSYICTLKKGTYRYYVYGKDLAGNAQSVVGSAKLKVK